MNRYQRLVVVAGAVVVLLMLVFPPFYVQVRGTTSNMGYGFIFDPPESGILTASVNAGVLLVQWVGVLMLTAFACFMLRSSGKSHEETKSTHISSDTSPPIKTDGEIPIDQSKMFFGGQHHPWRRYFARTVDFVCIGLPMIFLSFVIGYLLFPQAADILMEFIENPIIFSIVFYIIIWVPLEALFLSVAGTTPAKWIFGIRVISKTGDNLSYANALKRSFLVFVQGLGFGIPLVVFFTQFFAYRRLTKTGTTLWDTSVGSAVTHKKWSVIRVMAGVFLTLVMLVLVALVILLEESL